MESDASNKDKGTTKTDLETVRSALLIEKQKTRQIEENLKTSQRNCGLKEQEVVSLKAQLETLENVRRIKQQLLQQVEGEKNNVRSLTKQLLQKQEVSNIIMAKSNGWNNHCGHLLFDHL